MGDDPPHDSLPEPVFHLELLAEKSF